MPVQQNRAHDCLYYKSYIDSWRMCPVCGCFIPEGQGHVCTVVIPSTVPTSIVVRPDVNMTNAINIIRDLVQSPGAGLGWNEGYCYYCEELEEVGHAPDCPIIRGRKLVK